MKRLGRTFSKYDFYSVRPFNFFSRVPSGCFLGCGSGMLNWCMNIDQQQSEHCHSSCSTLAHDRGKNNAPTDPARVVGKKGLVSSLLFLPPLVGRRLLWLSRSRVTPPLLRKTLSPSPSPSATPRRDLLGARKHLRNGMVGRDGEGS